nr:MAG TPA: hypothetical protein [Caudoviricetes sp.]
MLTTQEARERLNKEARIKDKTALGVILDSPEGRWFLARLVQRLTVVPMLDPLKLAYAEGRRSVAVDLSNEIDHFFGAVGQQKLLQGRADMLEMQKAYEDAAARKEDKEDIHGTE